MNVSDAVGVASTSGGEVGAESGVLRFRCCVVFVLSGTYRHGYRLSTYASELGGVLREGNSYA